jgi:hypothetical protein
VGHLDDGADGEADDHCGGEDPPPEVLVCVLVVVGEAVVVDAIAIAKSASGARPVSSRWSNRYPIMPL